MLGNFVSYLRHTFLCKEMLVWAEAQEGNCEEELPKKPVGRLSAVCRPTVGCLSADS